jgi:hypothetical protein
MLESKAISKNPTTLEIGGGGKQRRGLLVGEKTADKGALNMGSLFFHCLGL